MWVRLTTTGANLGGGCRVCASPCDDLWLSNTTSVLQKNKTLWFICVEEKHEMRLKNLCKMVVKMHIVVSP